MGPGEQVELGHLLHFDEWNFGSHRVHVLTGHVLADAREKIASFSVTNFELKDTINFLQGLQQSFGEGGHEKLSGQARPVIDWQAVW